MMEPMRLARVYEERQDESVRVLVDRLWPRGFRRDDPRIDRWLPEVAPSTELRRWYDHRAERHDEFVRRYEHELGSGKAAEAFAELAALVADHPVTLLTATKHIEQSHLEVLARLLERDGHPRP